jgi:hypothetical protein
MTYSLINPRYSLVCALRSAGDKRKKEPILGATEQTQRQDKGKDKGTTHHPLPTSRLFIYAPSDDA